MIGKCSSKYIYLTNQVNDCNKGKTTNYIKKFACVSVVQFLQAIATKFGIKSFETMVQRWICNIALVLL